MPRRNRETCRLVTSLIKESGGLVLVDGYGWGDDDDDDHVGLWDEITAWLWRLRSSLALILLFTFRRIHLPHRFLPARQQTHRASTCHDKLLAPPHAQRCTTTTTNTTWAVLSSPTEVARLTPSVLARTPPWACFSLLSKLMRFLFRLLLASCLLTRSSRLHPVLRQARPFNLAEWASSPAFLLCFFVWARRSWPGTLCNALNHIMTSTLYG
ncbi:uncharacterized protein LY79DRAFT_567521 [Colletotrichum navitas]|uniref:Uncharacterized protein n=1 Tax=Colletotrichum navitas TaxID=681940 RepID=A0AAD8V025_9PEZI|nr:uncharacterized protein LY79DRAFT_567521 [Colletotrichum navitas]KAK1573853.1 hypothetical protein LY79DRAFT_567521 [Colletotrichum navitas]